MKRENIRECSAFAWSMRRACQVCFPTLLVLSWLALSALHEKRFVAHMASESSKPELPDFWLRPQADEAPRCRPLTGELWPDVHAITTHPNDSSVNVQTTRSCEDVKISKTLGIAVLSCDPGRHKWNAVMGTLEEHEPRGALWVMDYRTGGADAQPTVLAIDAFPDGYDFHPLGLGIHEVSANRARIFAVNHGELVNTIEVIDVFREAPASRWHAQYVRTVAHPYGTHTANSVQVLGANEILVTNTHASMRRPPPRRDTHKVLSGLYGGFAAWLLTTPLSNKNIIPRAQEVENLVGSGWIAHVSFADEVPVPARDRPDEFARGVHARVLAKHIPYTNGIGLAPNGRSVVVASTTATGVYIYPVRAFTATDAPDWRAPRVLGDPVLVPTPFFADNLGVEPPKRGAAVHPADPLGGASIFLAGNPSLVDLHEMLHAEGDAAGAPSWAVEIKYTGRTTPDAAPFRAESRMPTVPRGWSVRTIFQTNGLGYLDGGRRISMPSSTGVAWDQSCEGHGSLFITGLYAPVPLLCSGMYS
ncbi:hypothetical protein MSPP1_003833 [Malassezia sp. CBS 17886]|nr:hypothetical protein MSPP1_003833 [Malassezia sp. CBS 17886]